MTSLTVVYTDKTGESHFTDVEIPLDSELQPKLNGINLSLKFPATHMQLIMLDMAAVTIQWHPAPARQFVVLVQGTLEVEVSDGERRRFDQGALTFVEDTWGKGHNTLAVNDTKQILLACMPVPDDVQIR